MSVSSSEAQTHSFARAEQVTKLFDKRLLLVKLGVIMTNYTTELVTERLRPNPDICKFISASEMASLAKEELVHSLKSPEHDVV